jgi:hypothetical protein
MSLLAAFPNLLPLESNLIANNFSASLHLSRKKSVWIMIVFLSWR